MHKRLVITAALTLAQGAYAADTHLDNHPHDPERHTPSRVDNAPLSKPGQGAFGAIQEVIVRLEGDPATDWGRVDLEALRQHLMDMDAITRQVTVVTRLAIPGGSKLVIRPTTPRARQALERILSAHPRQLQQETGWEMQVRPQGEEIALLTTTRSPAEISKIRGLGYIGLLAYGQHHQRHHWAIATGASPHHRHPRPTVE